MARTLLAVGLFGLTTVAFAVEDSVQQREFEFRYQTRIGPIAAGAGPVHVFVPLGVENAQQRIVDERIEASIAGEVEIETTYGNRYWHGQIDRADGAAVEVRVITRVERQRSRVEPPSVSRRLSADERAQHADFLRANERVVVGHPILEPIRAEVRARAASDDPARVSRAIYDWVVDNVEYKKVGRGWGNGDTFWACNERYGNCTDFHALFISLARSEGIPARFEIGFPVPEERGQGEIGGYHCWVEYYLPEVGWFPIDASEAFKHPDKREFFFGSHASDRVHLSTGRDLRLGPDHRGEPLNYFVYPYVEVGGAAWDGPIDNRFSYSDAPPVGS